MFDTMAMEIEQLLARVSTNKKVVLSCVLKHFASGISYLPVEYRTRLCVPYRLT